MNQKGMDSTEINFDLFLYISLKLKIVNVL